MDSLIDEYSTVPRSLSLEEAALLEKQGSALVSSFKASKFTNESKKQWDLFYKRNADRFFKDRNWTLREFSELCKDDGPQLSPKEWTLLEVGCGVGNFIFPLLKEQVVKFIFACDISPKAVELVQSSLHYDSSKVKAFQHDIASDRLSSVIPANSVHATSMIFVLSAIKPELHQYVLDNIFDILAEDGLLLFRDYGLHDMAQIRFGRDTKIGENHYLRHDGTQSYFFSRERFTEMAEKSGFTVQSCVYVNRRTINRKEDIDQPRIFLQAKLRKK